MSVKVRCLPPLAIPIFSYARLLLQRWHAMYPNCFFAQSAGIRGSVETQGCRRCRRLRKARGETALLTLISQP
jgi:hypothetical protein